MRRGFDNMALNDNLLLSLPFREGTGTVLTHDEAKPHHPISLVHAPTWATVAGSGLSVLRLNGVNEYAYCPTASCADLDFTTGDFSLACWCYVEDMGSAYSLMGRFELDASGWETFFFNYLLTLRISTGGADPSVSCYGEDYDPDVWMLVGVSRSGAYPLFYRDGVAVESNYEAGGIPNPVTSARDLVIGVRDNKVSNFYNGKIWNPRIWGRNLSAAEHLEMFLQERHLFGG
jgi:hypothetical protein